MQAEGYEKRKIWTIIGIFGVFVVLIVSVALVNIISKMGKIEVYVGYAPFIANVSLDNRTVNNNAYNYLEPGEHTLKVSLDGFDAVEEVVVIDDVNRMIFGSLKANTEKGAEIANEHIKDYTAVQAMFGEEEVERGERNRKAWPVIQELPLSNSLYKVGYIIDGDEIKLTLSAYEAYVDVAVNKLKEAAALTGDDLAEYDIVFSNFDNNYKVQFETNEMTDPEASLIYGFSKVVDFELIDGIHFGDYYYANVSTGTSETYTLVHRKVILKKNGDRWEIASEVSPILTLYNTVDVPIDILRSANNLELL